MNKVVLIGRISNDLELRYTTNNKATVRFNIAINRVGTEETDFIPVQVWNSQAENLCKYQSKGSLIAIEGNIRVDNYTDKDGNKRTTAYVVASNVEFLQSRGTKNTEVAEKTTEPEEVESDPFADFGETVSIEDDNLLD